MVFLIENRPPRPERPQEREGLSIKCAPSTRECREGAAHGVNQLIAQASLTRHGDIDRSLRVTVAAVTRVHRCVRVRVSRQAGGWRGVQ